MNIDILINTFPKTYEHFPQKTTKNSQCWIKKSDMLYVHYLYIVVVVVLLLNVTYLNKVTSSKSVSVQDKGAALSSTVKSAMWKKNRVTKCKKTAFRSKQRYISWCEGLWRGAAHLPRNDQCTWKQEVSNLWHLHSEGGGAWSFVKLATLIQLCDIVESKPRLCGRQFFQMCHSRAK